MNEEGINIGKKKQASRKSLNFGKVFIQFIHALNEKANPKPSLLNFTEQS